jgi:hypothetical protein
MPHRWFLLGSLAYPLSSDISDVARMDYGRYGRINSFPVSQTHEKTLTVEIDRLVKLGALEWTTANEWAAPTFIIPKKNGSVRFVSDFRS